MRAEGTHIFWFHTNVFTELLHGLRADHFVGSSVLKKPGQAFLIGEQLLCDRLGTTDLRSGETTRQTHKKASNKNFLKTHIDKKQSVIQESNWNNH